MLLSTPGLDLDASAPVWEAERVVFLNDVYFCSRDVVRLLSHDADIACGMDFDRLKLQDAPKQVRFLGHLLPGCTALTSSRCAYEQLADCHAAVRHCGRTLLSCLAQ